METPQNKSQIIAAEADVEAMFGLLSFAGDRFDKDDYDTIDNAKVAFKALMKCLIGIVDEEYPGK